ncbi:hypothetical protein IAT40_005036 [Kwoniella sp. CBS 6097]
MPRDSDNEDEGMSPWVTTSLVMSAVALAGSAAQSHKRSANRATTSATTQLSALGSTPSELTPQTAAAQSTSPNTASHLATESTSPATLSSEVYSYHQASSMVDEAGAATTSTPQSDAPTNAQQDDKAVSGKSFTA